MPKNIREKLALMLDDVEPLSRENQLRVLERMIMNELEFLATDHKVDSYDLTSIRSRSIALYNDFSMRKEELGAIYQDGEMIRVLCMVEATIEFLRGRGLIAFTLRYNKK